MTCINKSKYAEIGRRLRNIPLEKHILSHEWEELVQKLCASDDESLHAIGNKEQDKLKQEIMASCKK